MKGVTFKQMTDVRSPVERFNEMMGEASGMPEPLN